MEVKGKIFKVEQCKLHRAFNACGKNLLGMINLVCSSFQRNEQKRKEVRTRRSVRPKVLTDACCESLCTISEMTRYCP